MSTLFIGKNCVRIDSTPSTNTFLSELQSSSPQPEGTVVVAHVQEQGRGQRGSVWESEPGKNLTLSILFKPHFLRPDEQFQLNKAVSLGGLDFLKCYLPDQAGIPSIKWPNDLYIGNKKAGGILIENTVSGNRIEHSIVGVGINVNQEKFSAGLPNATSLRNAGGRELDLQKCLEQLQSCIEKRYLQLRSGSAQLDADYLDSLYRLGQWATYKLHGKSAEAKISGLSKDGKLLLETKDGKRCECALKEVEFLLK